MHGTEPIEVWGDFRKTTARLRATSGRQDHDTPL
jgi:hypothetical protein